MKIKAIILVSFITVLLMGCTPKNVKETISKINAIGEVTLDSEEAIEDARECYDNLSNKEKESVTNYEDLLDAEDELEDLLAEKELEEELEELRDTFKEQPYKYAYIFVNDIRNSVSDKDYFVLDSIYYCKNNSDGKDWYYIVYSDGYSYDNVCVGVYDPSSGKSNLDYYNGGSSYLGGSMYSENEEYEIDAEALQGAIEILED